MKKIPYWLALLFLGATTFLQCTEHEDGPGMEKVQFTFNVKDVAAGGRVQLAQAPDALLLSLERSSGERVLSKKKITLLRAGDAFMTEPIDLPPGQYDITEFLLVAGEADVLFLTPLKNSRLAKVINHPLPYPITVSKNKIANIEMEVIGIGEGEPEDFGYTSFFVNTINPLRLSVIIPQGNGSTLTGAQAWIVEGNDTVKSYNLGATINFVGFPGDPQVPRKLIVSKPGYNTFTQAFVYTELIASLDGNPWKINLVKSVFTLTPYINPGPDNTPFSITLRGEGSATIDWGDGTVEDHPLGDYAINHAYAAGTSATIHITGDLDKITFVGFTDSDLTRVNVAGLRALETMYFASGAPHGPAEIDFTYNAQLRNVVLPSVHDLEKVILPASS